MTTVAVALDRAQELLRQHRPEQALAWLTYALRLDPARSSLSVAVCLLVNQRPWIALSETYNKHDVLPSGQRDFLRDLCPEGESPDPPRPEAQGMDAVEGWMLHPGTIYAACRSPDGQLLATVSSDHRTRLWDAELLRPLALPIENNPKRRLGVPVVAKGHVSMNSDGELLIIWDGQGGCRVCQLFPMTPAESLQLAAFAEVVAGLRVHEGQHYWPVGISAQEFVDAGGYLNTPKRVPDTERTLRNFLRLVFSGPYRIYAR